MANQTTLHHGESISLEKDEAVSFHRISRRMEIVCIDGALWVTFHGDPEDHLLKKGDRLRSGGRGYPVIYAIAKSEFCLQEYRTYGEGSSARQSSLRGRDRPWKYLSGPRAV